MSASPPIVSYSITSQANHSGSPKVAKNLAAPAIPNECLGRLLSHSSVQKIVHFQPHLFPHSSAAWLEQLDRIARGVVDQNLFPSRARNDLAAKPGAGLPQRLHQRYKIVSLKHQPVPAARDRLGTIGKEMRGGAPWPAQPERELTALYHRKGRAPPVHECEPKGVDVERQRSIDIADQVSDNGHVNCPDGEIWLDVSLTNEASRLRIDAA